MSRREEFNEKVRYVVYAVLYAIMFSFITQVLFVLNPETIIQNWGIGLIFSTLFAFFYIVDYETIPVSIFRIDKMNKRLFIFWFSWILGDWEDLLALLFQLIGGA
ncbi:MAG: hypothetical protein U9Q73_01950 [Nanoarchaeota archaeon]|nr:hypothetical protein [Nanoarchaeota archaeon]